MKFLRFIFILFFIGALVSCLKKKELATVGTTSITNKTASGCTSGGNITSDGGSDVTERGVCWSKDANPSIANYKSSDGKGAGTFTSNVSELEAGTTYHVRAYATNGVGTAYGNEVNLTTLQIIAPSLTTIDIAYITSSTAVSGGNVTDAGNGTITVRGVCWSIAQNPTVDLITRTSDGTGTGIFTSNLTGLTPSTKYYIRAYATNSADTKYGNELFFTTSCAPPTAPVIGTIIQPTCTLATGSVALSGLPSTGTWTLTRAPGETITSGTGTTRTVTGLPAGTTYTFKVTNASGCVSPASGYVTINSQAASPSAPVVGTITQPTCAVTTGSVALSGLPSTGTWTFTRTPGGTTTSGTGTTQTVTELPAGTTYTFTVTNSSGCVSPASGSIVIASLPHAPSAKTDPETNDGSTTATLIGTVNANGTLTTVSFEYGTSSIYGSSVSALPNQVTGKNNIVVSASLNNLTAYTTYHYRVKAVNCQGITYGDDRSFSTSCFAPNFVINTATNITATSATLNGVVDTYGSSTFVTFEYGTTSYYDITITAIPNIVSGFSHNLVSAELIGLSPNTTYHSSLKLIWCSGGDIGNTVDQTFTTYAATDGDGNNYTSVVIGTQVWLVENLKTTKYRNGDLIGTTTPANIDISSETTPVYQWPYDGNESFVATHGRLYTWFASTDPRGVCPTGWHIPSDEEWKQVEMALGMKLAEADASSWRGTDQGAQMKTTNGWESNGNGTNASGFSALPGGYRSFNGTFGNNGDYGYWWSSSESSIFSAWNRLMGYPYSNVGRGNDNKGNGLSVRCVRD